MPQINKLFTLDVTASKFLEACTAEELIELQMLLNSSRYQSKIDLHTKKQLQELEG